MAQQDSNFDWLKLLSSLGTYSALVAAIVSFYIFREDQESAAVLQRETQARQEIAQGLEAKLQEDLQEDRTQQDILQSYIQDMKNLLIDADLAKSEGNPTDRDTARALTIAAMRQLDGDRKGILLKFLYDSTLITSPTPKIPLREVDLSGANLRKTVLRNASLSGADLSDADLSGADLRDADLRDAGFSGAVFTRLKLSGADLTNAIGITEDQLAQAIVGTETPGSPGIDCSVDLFFDAFFQDVPPGGILEAFVGAVDSDNIELPEQHQGIFGIKFLETENREIFGGIKILPNTDNEIFRVISVVDDNCEEIKEFSNVSRGGKDTLINWDTLQIRFGRDVYHLRIGFDGETTGVNFFKKVS